MGQQMSDPQQLFPEQGREAADSDFSPEYTFEVENTDPREQHFLIDGPTYGRKLQPVPEPRRQRQRSPFWFVLVPLVLVFLIMGVGETLFSIMDHVGPTVDVVHFGHHMPMRGKPVSGKETFAINGSVPTVIINGIGSDVTIQTGNDGQVIVQSDGQGGNAAEEPGFFASQDGNTINITGTPPFFNNNAALSVIVPANANIVINGSGTVHIQGVTGQISAIVNGTITMQQVTLVGTSNFHTGGGSVNFQGTIASGGQVEVDTGSGSVNMQLPGNSALHVAIFTGSGTINNQFGSDQSGNTSLTIRTGSGSITVRKN